MLPGRIGYLRDSNPVISAHNGVLYHISQRQHLRFVRSRWLSGEPVTSDRQSGMLAVTPTNREKQRATPATALPQVKCCRIFDPRICSRLKYLLFCFPFIEYFYDHPCDHYCQCQFHGYLLFFYRQAKNKKPGQFFNPTGLGLRHLFV